MNFIFIGTQGSGKGTQAKIISKKLKLCHISSGDLLRSTKDEQKEKIDKIINAGKLVPNKLMLEIIKKRIKKKDCKNGIILDGFPRNLKQAKMINKELKIEKIIEMEISDDEARIRISGRYHCPKCLRGYNIYTQPMPKKEGICDKCHTKLIQRDDDNEKSVNKRLKTYHKELKKIERFYKNKIIKINCEKPIAEVTKEILKLI